MAIFGNFKGTTKSEFQIGKSGTKLSTGTRPSAELTVGDIFVDAANASLQVYNNAWVGIGETLTELNVDNGTLFVDSSNDTVSIGSTASNEKLFVNGSLRLGTNPAIKYSGAYLDLQHSNGTATQLRIRDNTSGVDPVFKVYSANNTSEVFKVQGANVRIHDAYNMPTTDGTSGQVLQTDGSGALSFATVNANPGGANTQIQFNNDGSFDGSSAFTFDDDTDTVTTGIVQGVVFERITDYGTVADTPNISIDMGTISDGQSATDNYEYLTDTYGPAADGFSVSRLPSADQPGQMIYVKDETGGPVMAFSDGTNWRRITDREIVS